jgi:hypothetical protein
MLMNREINFPWKEREVSEMNTYFVRYLKKKAKKEKLLKDAQLNMAKQPQVA